MAVLRKKNGRLDLKKMTALGMFESRYHTLLGRSTPLVITNTRANATVSPMTGLEVAANTVDSLTRGRTTAVFSRAGYTTLVPEDVENDWAIPAGVSVSSPSAGIYEIDITTGNRVNYDATTVAANEYIFTFAVKRGTATDIKTKVFDLIGVAEVDFTINNGGTVSGPTSIYTLTNSDDYVTIDIRFTAPDTSTRVYLVASNDAGTIFVKCPRMALGTVRMVPVPVGSAAGYVTNADLLQAPPSWPTSGTLVAAVRPYYWTGGDNPVSAIGARFWNANNNFIGFFPGRPTMTGSGAFPQLIFQAGEAVLDAVNVMSFDYDGANIGGRWEDVSRITLAETDSPTGALYLLNHPLAQHSFHGLGVFPFFPWVLSDAEYAIVRQGLQADWGGFAWVA